MRHLDSLVSQYSRLFVGAPRESLGTLEDVERALSVSLPSDLKALLLNHGYGSSAVPSIKTSLNDTLRFRSAVGLPNRYLVLDDMNDAGAVLLDTQTSEGAVIWVDSHCLDKVRSDSLSEKEYDVFPTFASWLENCLELDAQNHAT